MKRLFFAFGLLLSSLTQAQQEIKIDIADALIIKSLEFSYERYINSESSFGISALFNLTKESEDFRYNEDLMITPYYRHYFSSDATWNLFGEGFVGINSGKGAKLVEYTDAALGIAIGTKYVSQSGLTIDLYGGLGRNLFTTVSPVIVPRAGLNIGWRF